MAGVGKHANSVYSGGVPLAVGDRLYGQEYLRDHLFSLDEAGLLAADVLASPLLVSGGLVTHGAGDTLNITAAVGWAAWDVTIPTGAWADPPATATATLAARRVVSTAQTNMAIPDATLDGVTVNYVKLRYAESDGSTRQRRKKAGSYAYERLASFAFVVSAVTPGAYDVVLASFTGTPGGAFTITQHYPGGYKLAVSADYSVIDALGVVLVTTGAGNKTISLPALASAVALRGWPLLVQKVDSGAGKVIVDPSGAETVNGTATWEITDQWGYVLLVPTASDWKVMANSGTIYALADTSDRTQATPVSGTWYNLGSLSLTLPPGRYALHYCFPVYYAHGASAGTIYLSAAISTSSNSASDADLMSLNGAQAAASEVFIKSMTRDKQVVLSGSTIYYLIARVNSGTATATLGFYASTYGVPTRMWAERIG